MPVSCDICEEPHKVQDCPFKGICIHCRQAGHVQGSCPNPPNAWGTAADNPTPAEANTAPVNEPLAAAAPTQSASVAAAPLAPVSTASPASLSAAPAFPVSYSDSSEAVSEEVDNTVGSESMDSQSQSILSSQPSSEDCIDSFTTTASEQVGSDSVLWSDLSSHAVNAIDSQIADVFGASVDMDIADDSDVNNNIVVCESISNE